MSSTDRSKPNVLITGTPCTGKTTLAAELASRLNFKHLNVGDLAKENNFYDGFDDEFECPVLDEDKVLDEMEDDMAEGGVIVDYHGCSFFPERFFDIVFVLRTDNSALFDRLHQRNYNQSKIDNNLQCEIFQTILDEAQESYDGNIVHELRSDSTEDLEQNLEKIALWIQSWSPNQS